MRIISNRQGCFFFVNTFLKHTIPPNAILKFAKKSNNFVKKRIIYLHISKICSNFAA